MGLPEGPWSPGPGEEPYVPSPFPLPPGDDMGLPEGPSSPGPGEHAQMQNYLKFWEMMNQAGMSMSPDRRSQDPYMVE